VAINQIGIAGYGLGTVADQTLLLQDIVDGLGVYNAAPDPMIEMFSQEHYHEVNRISQAPMKFGRMADGGNSEASRMFFRTLTCPIDNYDLAPEFTMLWHQDALPSDVDAIMKGALAGDAQLVNAKFYEAIFTKRTVGAVGTNYRAGFYNGETDVPQYKNNAFSSAHYHYLGANQTTIDLSLWRAMKKDIQEHGYGLTPGGLLALVNSAQVADIMAMVNTNASSTILQGMTPERQRAIDNGLFGTGVNVEGVLVKVDDNVPANYVAMMATDVQPLTKRVHLNPAYRGVQAFRESPNEQYPLLGLKFVRRIGFSGAIMGAGTCRYLTGSTTYTNPSFQFAV
jgi:hypothetical protein